MADLFDFLFGKTSKPLRRDVNVRFTVDEDGTPKFEIVDGMAVSLSPGASIDRINVGADRFYHCGCNAEQPLGGRCGIPACRRISCATHHGGCDLCKIPICLEHSRFLDVEKNQTVRLCLRCYEAKRRKQKLVTGAKWLLSPFVVFEQDAR